MSTLGGSKNAVCKSLRKPAFAGLRKAQDLVEKSKGILSAANAVLIGAEHVVKISKRSLDIVNAVLEGVKRAYQAGTKALSAVAKFGLGGVFELKRFSLNINLRDILSFVKAIGERAFKGIKKFLT